MKKAIKALAAHSKLLSKSLAAVRYLKKDAAYWESQQLIAYFADTEKRNDPRYIRKLTLDMIFSRFYNRISLEEYFLYQFEDKSVEERHAYIGDNEQQQLCDEIGDAEHRRTLVDKYRCYMFFQKFFGRDIVRISTQEDRAAFEKFFSIHEKFIVKPVDQARGRGIYCVRRKGADRDELFQDILAKGPCVMEEYIDQSPEMARFHPQSVNTIRIATFNNSGSIKILFAALRVGVGESVIDNAGAGGIFASVNAASGKIESFGHNKKCEVYQKHPDTGCTFKGFQIPYWSDLIQITLEAVQAFPQHNYISWDFALTASGWLMVEANYNGGFVMAQMTRGGIRNLFMEEFNEYKNQKTLQQRISRGTQNESL